MRQCLPAIFVALVLAQMPAVACSPSLVSISPLDAMGPTSVLKFSRVVLAEVVGTSASDFRLAKLQAWRSKSLASAAVQVQAKARYAELVASATKEGREIPPPLPPLPGLLKERQDQMPVIVDLFVLENLIGAPAEQIRVTAGGQCGSFPQVGQEVLVFIEENGLTHLLQRSADGGPYPFDEKYLDKVRACAKGNCPETGGR